MRILSPYSDYYDKMRCYSNPTYCSNDFTYVRKTKDIIFPGMRINFTAEQDNEELKHKINRYIIGFCGNWYFMYSSKTRNNYYNVEHQHLNYDFYSHIKDALVQNFDSKYLKKNYSKNTFATYSIFKKHRKPTFIGTLQTVLNVYTKYENNLLKEYTEILKPLNLFEKHNTPILEIKYNANTLRDHTLVINPNLEKLSFYKLIEGNIAYQEIEMFLGNELLPKDNPDQITDNNIKIANHGFDARSFRKDPSKAEKRLKRKINKLKKKNKAKDTK